MSYQTLAVEMNARGVLRITLSRPDIRNAFNEVMIRELTEVFSKKAKEPSVRAIVLQGSGSVFCAGGDLNWMRRSIEVSYEENLADTLALTRMFALMNETPKPLIGLVHGAAIGGGVGLVSVCDIVLATADTTFSLSEVRLGVVPACIGPFVVAKIGASHARCLFTSAERFQAAKAQSIGLVHEVAENEAELQKIADRTLENILQSGPNAVSIAKKLVLDLTWPERRKQDPDCIQHVAEVLAKLRITPEAQEGVRAFLEKRKPEWLKKG